MAFFTLEVCVLLLFLSSCAAINKQSMSRSSSKYPQVPRRFEIDYENNQFLKDGEPFRYIAGSIHYFRIPPIYWRDRLLKMKAGGLNAVEFYIPWNLHEPREGHLEFGGSANLTRFLDILKDLDMAVILRGGPYVCGEWENGGFPWWLLKNHTIRLRSSDPGFLQHVDKWYSYLFPLLLPYLWKNGGPIALIQVENEYGSFSSCDVVYTTHLRDLFHSYVGYDTQLISVDGGGLGYLKCGYIPGVYPTVDGSASKGTFEAQRTYAPRGPLVNTEYYPGWLDLWGKTFPTVTTDAVLKGMHYMWNINASFNFYMFEGGTNFGYTNGAATPYLPVATTYDYDAPLSEAGDPTPKFFAIRETIKNFSAWVVPSQVPPATKKLAYGKVELMRMGSVLDLLKELSPKKLWRYSEYPLSMEDMDFPYGFVLYQTTIPPFHKTHTHSRWNRNTSGILSCSGVKDRGYVMVNGIYQGFLTAQLGKTKNWTLNMQGKAGDKLQILIENNGRQCSGWGKGQLFVNRFNVGRYWPTFGPQVTLYIPKSALRLGLNRVVMLELEKPGCVSGKGGKCAVSFTDIPHLNKTVPPWNTPLYPLHHL